MTTKLPVKIEPERLKDTIIEIRYQSDTPFEYRLGLCHKILTEHGFSIFEPLSPNPAEADPLHFFLTPKPKNVFKNDVARFYFESERIVFNSNGEYQGWSKFLKTAQECLALLVQEQLIGNIYWAGLRYISEFDNIQIFDQLKWTFEYSRELNTNINTSFRTEWVEAEDHVIVNLLNNAQRETASYSLMDIDVNHTLVTAASTVDALIPILIRLHEKEKQVFFGLMRDEFLTTLNPTYE